MPLYLTQHSLACLTRQGAEELGRKMQAQGGAACAQRIIVNMTEGKMVAEFRAASLEALETFLRSEKMHFDWILRVELEMHEGKLQTAD